MRPACPIIVMAKAPVAGYAKTRLIPALGSDGAATLAERLLEHAADQAMHAALGPVEICCAPHTRHRAFERLARQEGVVLTEQGDGDLGARMARALKRSLSGSVRRAVLIGTDAPALDASVLRQAAAALDTHDAVFVPAVDGGYALIGLRRPAPSLFDGVAWGTSSVMASTRERLVRARLRHAELAPVHDIDEPADLIRLPPGWLDSGACVSITARQT